MIKHFIFTTLILTALACTQKSSPCAYDEIIFKAEVTEITSYQEDGQTLHHVKLDFNKSSLYGTDQYLEKIKEVKIDSAFLKRNNLKIGNIYSGTVSEILEGNCQSLYISFNQKLR